MSLTRRKKITASVSKQRPIVNPVKPFKVDSAGFIAREGVNRAKETLLIGATFFFINITQIKLFERKALRRNRKEKRRDDF
jgi:hypothetical protein